MKNRKRNRSMKKIVMKENFPQIGHNVDSTTSLQCGPSTLSPLTNTEIAINPLCDKDIDDDDDYEDECYDFQDELFNFEQILKMSRYN
jgi:hypothetical protein